MAVKIERRTGFEIMPTEGSRDPRSTARIINSGMSGKTNNVIDIMIGPADWPATIQSPIISAQSYIDLKARNMQALSLTTIVVEQGRGYCVLDWLGREAGQIESNYGAGAMEAIDQGWAWGGSENWSSLNFDTDIAGFQMTRDLINDRMICSVPGDILRAFNCTLTVSGEAKEDSEFMFALSRHEEGSNPSDPTQGTAYVIIPNKSGVSDPYVGVSIAVPFAMDTDDFLMGWKWAKDTGSGGSNNYDSRMSAVSMIEQPPETPDPPTTDSFYRMVVIG